MLISTVFILELLSNSLEKTKILFAVALPSGNGKEVIIDTFIADLSILELIAE